MFDRGERSDPRVDSIVRVEASRLRTKIDEYYRGTNGADAVVIRLPKGTYTPEFEARQRSIHEPSHTSASPPARRNRRWIAVSLAAVVVLVVVGFATDRYPQQTRCWLGAGCHACGVAVRGLLTDPELQLLAARVTDGVTTEVARLGSVSVVSHTSALQFAGVRRPMRGSRKRSAPNFCSRAA